MTRKQNWDKVEGHQQRRGKRSMRLGHDQEIVTLTRHEEVGSST